METTSQENPALSAESRFAYSRYAYGIFAFVALLVPVFFVPFVALPLSIPKAALAYGGVFLALVLFLIERIRARVLSFPRSLLLLAAFLIPPAYLISALSSSLTGALFGEGFETDTFFAVFLFSASLFLAAYLFHSKKRIFHFYRTLLFVGLLLALFQFARLIFGASFLSAGVLTSAISNVVGTWNDLGIFFALLAALSLLLLDGFFHRKFYRAVSFIVLISALFFLALINFEILWVALGLFSLFLILRRLPLLRPLFARAGFGAPAAKTIPVGPVLVFLCALLFLFSGGSVAGPLNDFFGTAQLEARPSFSSTYTVLSAVYKENALWGEGPGTFGALWLLHKPQDIVLTPFWNVNFDSGFGYIPTAFVTTGIIGGALWILLFLAYCATGIKLLRKISDETSRVALEISFWGSLLLFAVLFVYDPSLPLILLLFILMGIMLSLGTREGVYPHASQSLSYERKAVGPLLLSAVLLILSVGGLYLSLSRSVGAAFGQSASAELSRGDIDAAEWQIRAAKFLAPTDRTYRITVDVHLARLALIVRDTSLANADLQKKFEVELQGAITDAAKAVRANSRNYANSLSRAALYAELVPLRISGAYENARLNYEEARKLNPKNPAILLLFARLELLNGNEEGAREHIARAIDMKGNFTEAAYFLSQLEISEGNTKEAIAATESAAALSPNDPVLYFQLGFLRYSSKEYTKAAEALERAITLAPAYSNARYFLGLSLYEKDRVSEALRQFEEVSRLNPDNEEVKRIIENLKKGKAPFAPPNEKATPPEKREKPPLPDRE